MTTTNMKRISRGRPAKDSTIANRAIIEFCNSPEWGRAALSAVAVAIKRTEIGSKETREACDKVCRWVLGSINNTGKVNPARLLDDEWVVKMQGIADKNRKALGENVEAYRNALVEVEFYQLDDMGKVWDGLDKAFGKHHDEMVAGQFVSPAEPQFVSAVPVIAAIEEDDPPTVRFVQGQFYACS